MCYVGASVQSRVAVLMLQSGAGTVQSGAGTAENAQIPIISKNDTALGSSPVTGLKSSDFSLSVIPVFPFLTFYRL